MGVTYQLKDDDIKLLNELTVSTYELGKFAEGGYTYKPGQIMFVPETAGATVWTQPQTRTLTVGEHEFKVHPDGTVHIDPEAFVKLLEKAGIA